MPRYLVIAHRTLGSPELLAALVERSDGGRATFHLLVPEYHGGLGLTYTDTQARAVARESLAEAQDHFAAHGLLTTGEVGEASPVEAVATVLERDGADAYDVVLVSTLPPGVSKWLGLDAPTQIRRHFDDAINPSAEPRGFKVEDCVTLHALVFTDLYSGSSAFVATRAVALRRETSTPKCGCVSDLGPCRSCER